MREIKFRAWHKDYNFMILPDEIAPYNYEIITGEGKVMEFEERHSYTGSTIDWEDISDKYVLMQYTGLKDKNGKEIYEQDIVDFDGKKHMITFANGGFGIWKEMRTNLYSDETRQYHEPLWNLIVDGCEIIGNRFEHPHLLEESK